MGVKAIHFNLLLIYKTVNYNGTQSFFFKSSFVGLSNLDCLFLNSSVQSFQPIYRPLSYPSQFYHLILYYSFNLGK